MMVLFYEGLILWWSYFMKVSFYDGPVPWDAVMPTLAFGGRLTLFSLVSRSPASVHLNLPLFTSTINIEYLVKNKTNLVWDLAHF